MSDGAVVGRQILPSKLTSDSRESQLTTTARRVTAAGVASWEAVSELAALV